MGFFDMLNPDERRWRKEAKQEAKDYLSDAREAYDDYKEYKSEARKVANKLNDLVRSYNDYKAGVLRELSGNISVSIENFRNFNINSHVVSVPNIRTGAAPNIPSVNISSVISNMPGGSFNPINIALSVFSDPYKDRDEAREQMDKAQEYLWKVEEARDSMKFLWQSLNNSLKYIEDEKTNLAQLMDKVRSIVNQLNAAMTRNSFTEKEAQYMTGISKIAEKIKDSLEQRIFDNSGNIEKNYKLYSDKIREINKLIPAAPTISDSCEWIADVIVY